MPLILNMIQTTIHRKTSAILKILDKQECIKTIYLKDNLLFNLQWWFLNKCMDNQVEIILTQICNKLNSVYLNLVCLLNQYMVNQVECIQTKICHKLNLVHLNLVLCHPNNTVNLEFLEICHRNNMEFLEICHQANLVILLCKINMHNNHTSIDT